MSKEKNEGKLFPIIIIVSIIIMSGMSVGIFILSNNLQDERTRYSETSEILSNLLDLADIDVQSVLQDDGAKHETAYSYLQDLYVLNELYESMVLYEESHPGNYSQQDFDAVAMEFTAKLRQLIITVKSTWAYGYCIEVGADVTNNYTYAGEEFFLIWNKWNSTSEPIYADLKTYVEIDFALSAEIVELPEIRMNKWTENLYGNLTILIYTDYQTSILYGERNWQIPFSFVNLSLSDLAHICEGYLTLTEKANTITEDYNNTLITIATSAVIIAFAISFDSKKSRLVTLIIGFIVLFLAIVYLSSTFDQSLALAGFEATQIVPS